MKNNNFFINKNTHINNDKNINNKIIKKIKIKKIINNK